MSVFYVVFAFFALFTWPVAEYVTYSRFRRQPRSGWLHALAAFVLCLFLNVAFADALSMKQNNAESTGLALWAGWIGVVFVTPLLVFLFRWRRWR